MGLEGLKRKCYKLYETSIDIFCLVIFIIFIQTDTKSRDRKMLAHFVHLII